MNHYKQAFKISRADSCTSGIVIVFRIVIQTKIAWKVHFSFMFWRCYCQLLFLSQLILRTQYWLILLILCSWTSKSVIIGLLHSCNWLKSWIFVHLFEFHSRFNIWLTWIGSEYFKSLVNWTLFVEFCFIWFILLLGAWTNLTFLLHSHFVRKGPIHVIIAIFTQFFLSRK